MLEFSRGLDGFDQCPPNTATSAENDRHAGLGKRPKVNPVSRFVFRFKLPCYQRLAPWMAARSPRASPKKWEMNGRTVRKIL